MRIVVVSPTLPIDNPDNAGERYLGHLTRTLSTDHQLIYLVPDNPSNRRAAPTAVADHILVALDVRIPHVPPIPWLVAQGRQIAPDRPPAGFLTGLRRSHDARRALSEADIVDLQWEESAAMLPQLRAIAPHARFVSTLHDVVKQRFDREATVARGWRQRFKSAGARVQARLVERLVRRQSDTIVVLSEKDRDLVGDLSMTTVIYPPLAVDAAPRPEQSTEVADNDLGAPAALFVGPLHRPANYWGISWLVGSVWPTVLAAIPRARLLIAGNAPAERVASLAGHPRVDVLGFRDDLNALHDQAAVVVAPLLLGAGVKFKVVDALVRGIPVVGTSIAMEGIGDATWFPTAHDEPESFAAELIRILRDPATARHDAEQARQWAEERYGEAQFRRRVRDVYGGLTPAEMPASEAADGFSPAISVVIPVRNGQAVLPDQLDSLAREPEAPSIEVVVADNGSTDRTREVALNHRACFGDLRVVDAGQRPGVAHARNEGARAARGRHIIFVDADDEIRPGYVKAMEQAFSDADLVAARTVTARLSGQSRALREDPVELPTALGYLPYGLGCALGVSREVMLRLRGFDESFAGGHEEVDFCWRAQRAGYQIRRAPDAVLDYRQRPTVHSAFRQFRRYASSSMMLWVRYHDSAPLIPVSFKGAARNLLRAPLMLPGLLASSSRFETARRLGWTLGTVDGHLAYRFLGKPPAPILMDAVDERRSGIGATEC